MANACKLDRLTDFGTALEDIAEAIRPLDQDQRSSALRIALQQIEERPIVRSVVSNAPTAASSLPTLNTTNRTAAPVLDRKVALAEAKRKRDGRSRNMHAAGKVVTKTVAWINELGPRTEVTPLDCGIRFGIDTPVARDRLECAADAGLIARKGDDAYAAIAVVATGGTS